MSRAVKPGAIDWDVFFRKDDSSLQALLRKSPSHCVCAWKALFRAYR